MGVHRITSEAAKYYAVRERILGSGITLLGAASEKIGELDKSTAEKLGDLASYLLPHSPGYAGKLMAVTARLFWAVAGVREKDWEFKELDEIEKEIEDIKSKVES